MKNEYTCEDCGENSVKEDLLDDGNTCPSCGSDALIPPHEFAPGEFADTCKLCGDNESSHQ